MIKDKLNIGCGFEKKEGYINIDISIKVEPDMVVDVRKGLPFPDNTFIEIYSCHALEHIEPDYFMFVLNEIARVAKPNCILELNLPFDNLYQRTHINHFRTFNWDSFYSLEEGSGRNYYSNLVLRNLLKRPNKLIRLFFNLFPFFKQNVYFKFLIIKNAK